MHLSASMCVCVCVEGRGGGGVNVIANCVVFYVADGLLIQYLHQL